MRRFDDRRRPARTPVSEGASAHVQGSTCVGTFRANRGLCSLIRGRGVAQSDSTLLAGCGRTLRWQKTRLTKPVGERHEQRPDRRVTPVGKDDAYCVVDGQKVPLKRTRLRTKENREQRLGSYELFQRSTPLQQGV